MVRPWTAHTVSAIDNTAPEKGCKKKQRKNGADEQGDATHGASLWISKHCHEAGENGQDKSRKREEMSAKE